MGPCLTFPALLLNDGHHIPQLGFGTWQIAADETAAAVRVALEIGYRHLDTAQMYRNERGVGAGIRAAGVPREEVFLTTKLGNDAHLPADAERAFERSLVELDTDYVDLFLIHWPMIHSYGGDYATTWRVLEGFRADGRARSIGVSNFRVVDLERLRVETDVVPAVNQIEAHPFFPNDEVREYDRAHRIVTEAWSPLAQGDVLDDTVVAPDRGADRPGALPGGPALASAAWRRGLPQVRDPRSHPRELRCPRLRAGL